MENWVFCRTGPSLKKMIALCLKNKYYMMLWKSDTGNNNPVHLKDILDRKGQLSKCLFFSYHGHSIWGLEDFLETWESLELWKKCSEVKLMFNQLYPKCSVLLINQLQLKLYTTFWVVFTIRCALLEVRVPKTEGFTIVLFSLAPENSCFVQFKRKDIEAWGAQNKLCFAHLSNLRALLCQS